MTDSEYSIDERHMEALDCICTSPTHVVTVELDLSGRDELEDPTLSLAVQLSPFLPWYKRAYLAVRYVLGMRDTLWGGHWDVCLLDKKSVKKLQTLLTAWTIVQNIREHLRKLPPKKKKTFDQALDEAREALTHIGTGELRDK